MVQIKSGSSSETCVDEGTTLDVLKNGILFCSDESQAAFHMVIRILAGLFLTHLSPWLEPILWEALQEEGSPHTAT